MSDLTKQLEDLSGYELTIPDGKLKDCLVYHEAIKDVIGEAIKALEAGEGLAGSIELLLKENLTDPRLLKEALERYNATQPSPRSITH